jgi:hypothetical protein
MLVVDVFCNHSRADDGVPPYCQLEPQLAVRQARTGMRSSRSRAGRLMMRTLPRGPRKLAGHRAESAAYRSIVHRSDRSAVHGESNVDVPANRVRVRARLIRSPDKIQRHFGISDLRQTDSQVDT